MTGRPPRPALFRPTLLALALLLPVTTGCIAWTGRARTIDTRSGEALGTEQLADALAGYDVVFLGEEHDSSAAHRLQIELTRALYQRRPRLAISMEMFERDVQNELDFYLLGVTSEQRMLANTRPWSNYQLHYRPAIEFARKHELDVIAANCPRPLAAKTAREGLDAVIGDGFVATNVCTYDRDYRRRFDAAMGGHGDVDEASARMDNFYAAQCVKDDTMAESIHDYLRAHASDEPLVVHWCGRFHSDYGQGTVSRLARRDPNLKIAVVSTVSAESTRRSLSKDERRLGQFVWLVPRGD